MSIKSKTRPMCRKLSVEQAKEIRQGLKEGRGKAELARAYEVGLGVVEGIAKWETYRDAIPEGWGS